MDAENGTPLTGVVLAGGLSTRMGRHKPGIRLHGEDGPDLLARNVALLRTLLPRVLVSCRAGGELPQYDCVTDLMPGLGPIAGVQAALAAANGPVLALSCDMPFMDAPTLCRLIRAWGERPPQALMATFRQAETGYIEALAAIYSPSCLPLINEAVSRGTYRLGLVVSRNQRVDVVYTRKESLPFFNINYPADLETARKMLREL